MFDFTLFSFKPNLVSSNSGDNCKYLFDNYWLPLLNLLFYGI